MKQETAVTILFNAVPYSNQIKDLDMTEEGVLRFTWREDTYRFSYRGNPFVETVAGPILRGDNTSIILQELLTKQYAAHIISGGEK